MRASCETIMQRWQAEWEKALAIWSKYTKLHEPSWCLTHKDAAREGLSSSFAMIRLTDQNVVIDVEKVIEENVADFALEILAHEIGHHVLAPANLTDHARAMARIRRGLPTLERFAPQVSNLYYDLIINDRLQRSYQLQISEVYARLAKPSKDKLWLMYQRTYEILWSIPRGTLAQGTIDQRIEGDAQLAAKLTRVYAKDWVRGAGRYAALCLPYLVEADDKQFEKVLGPWMDTKDAGKGGLPDGLTEIEADELEGNLHPSLDPLLNDDEEETQEEEGASPDGSIKPHASTSGQARQPYEYGEILRALGIELSDHEAAVRYYRERAMPYLIPFPTKEIPEVSDPLPEGLEPWEIGSPLDQADWLQTVTQRGCVIPGFTVVQRVWGNSQGNLPDKVPFNLDLYVDCSGSMPNPQIQISYLALAGAIVCLSALRAGAKVQVTLWSGKNQYDSTLGFVRDEKWILRVLTGFFGGATQFPINVLRDTFAQSKKSATPTHILVISDSGIDTMFTPDEHGVDGWKVVKDSLDKAAGGGTMVLNIPESLLKNELFMRARAELGWHLHAISSWEDLIVFSKKFSQEQYGG